MRRAVPRPPDVDFAGVLAEHDLPTAFAADVLAEADAVRPAAPPVDATEIELITVDPPGARDLDQALHLAARAGGGYRISYAIADVAASVAAGGAVDAEAWRRGETIYLPDRRIPLHPPAISEGAASLLPGQDRPAVLWQLDLDAEGRLERTEVRRALVRSRAQLDYAGLQAGIEAGNAPEGARLFAEVGPRRSALARARGAIELGLPDQEVVRGADGRWTLEHRVSPPVEEWNAQISLLTGCAAADLMLEAEVGLLRTLPAPDPRVVRRLRTAAQPLDVDWPEGTAPGEVLAGLDATRPRHAAFLDLAAELLRGAGYTPLDGSRPPDPGHAGVGAPYAHVTAPIRRLCDRATSEVCLAVAAGAEVPAWARTALVRLPEAMADSGRRARAVERTAVDLVEAWLLQDRVGERMTAAVVEVDDERDRSTVVIDDPAIRATCTGRLPLGERVEVRLTEADPAGRTVRFAPA